MESIEIEYLPKADEHLEAYSLYDSTTTGWKIDRIAALVLIVIGTYLIWTSVIAGIKVFYMALGTLFAAAGIIDFFGLFSLVKIFLKIQFNNNRKFKNIQKVKFAENVIEYETEGVKSNIDWKFYVKYYEGENVIILVYGKRQYSVFPKYAFGDKLDDFKIMLEKHIKQ